MDVFRLDGDLLAAGDALVGDRGLTSARWQVLGAIAFSPVPLPVAHFRSAFINPEFQARLSAYPESMTISSHLFHKLAVPGICVA